MKHLLALLNTSFLTRLVKAGLEVLVARGDNKIDLELLVTYREKIK